jgi:ADP-heptose:LPS heptosyltransferase
MRPFLAPLLAEAGLERTTLLAPLRLLRYPRSFDLAVTNTVSVFKVAAELQAFFAARFSLGFRYPEEKPADRLYDATLPVVPDRHEVDQNLALPEHYLGCTVPEQDRIPAARRKAQCAHPPQAILLHPGSAAGYEYKRWPAKRFVALAKRLSEAGIAIHVLIGPSERSLQKQFGTDASILTPRNPRELFAALRRVDGFVGNDSGPAHLAAFLGLPSVALFGPVDPARAAPRGEGVEIVYNRQECSPCHFDPRSCAEIRCMESITVEQVCEEACDLFGIGRSGPHPPGPPLRQERGGR